MTATTAIIQCESDTNWERLLEKEQGVTLLGSLVSRLRSIRGNRRIYLYAERATARGPLIQQARGLGIRILHRSPSALVAWLQLAWDCVLGRPIIRVSETCPFVDPEGAARMLERLMQHRADRVYAVGFPEGTTPVHALSPTALLRATGKNLLRLMSSPDLSKAMHGILSGSRTAYVRMDEVHGAVKIPQSFVVRTKEELSILRELYGADIQLAGVAALYRDPERAIQHLLDRRRLSSAPHVINAVLNRYEAETGRTRLHSFPVYVGFNIMPICDVDCKFCSFSPQEMDSRERVTLEEFKRLDWVKYASELAIWGGIGESLINPEFVDIFNYALERFPHLKISLSTIGKSLRPEIADQLVGRLSFLNVSLNAARKDTHAKLVKAGRFERVIENLRYLIERRKAKGTGLPRVHLSMVVMRENVEEMPEFIDLAADLGVDHAVVSHFLATTIEGERKAGDDSSLYHHRELADAMLIKSQQRAAARGLSVSLPPLFSKPDCNVLFGSRSEFGLSGDCLLPWSTCHLSVDERGRRQMLFCCSGMYLRAFYDVSHLDETSFMKLWNGPIPQHFRGTTNGAGNPLCTFCKTEDRFDPANKKIYDIDQSFGQALETLGGQEPLSLVTVTKRK